MIKKSSFAMVMAIVAILALPLLVSAAVVNTTVSVVSVATSSMAIPPVGLPVMPSAPCYSFSRSLSIGITGNDVTELQNFLNEQGYLSVTATGYFGVLTRAAVGRWQAANNVASVGSYGNGTFGPLSRAFFNKMCGGNNGGGGGQGGGVGSNPTSTQAVASFSANPQSGNAPLTVQFIASAPQGTTLGNTVDFGDGTQGKLGFIPVCSQCNAEGVVSHTYTTTGTYTATLTNDLCVCPTDGQCNCPNIPIIATTTVVVGSVSTSTTATSSIQQLNSPGSVTLSPGGIAEILNENMYFTLQSITSSSATISITPVGCWNSFPSEPQPKVVCMIAMVPIPPQTLTVGQAYSNGDHSVTLAQLTSSTATFTIE